MRWTDKFWAPDEVPIEKQARLTIENLNTLTSKGLLPQNEIQAATTAAMGTLAASYGEKNFRAT